MKQAILIVESGEILRDLSMVDAGDMVSSGRARWLKDLPNIHTDVPATVETAAAAEAAEEPAADPDPSPPESEIDDDLGEPKPSGKAGGKGRKRP